MERREHPREALHQNSVLSIKNRTIPCAVRNISAGGALIEVMPPDSAHLSQDDVGQEAVFEMTGESGGTSHKGRVIRYIHNGDHAYLALFFL
jgi:hypothetical protein